MSYYYLVLKDNPVGMWPMDSTLGLLKDGSGYNHDATSLATLTPYEPIVANGISSLHSTANVNFPFSQAFIAGKELRNFSLELWVKNLSTVSGTANLLLRNSDGLTYANNMLTFTLSGQSMSYYVDDPAEPLHIVVNYDVAAVTMFVNGSRVATFDVTNPDFSALTNANVIFTGNGKVVIDSVAFYNYSLPSETIVSHYQMGTAYYPVSDAGLGKPVVRWTFNAQNANVALERYSDWSGDVDATLAVDGDAIYQIPNASGTYDTGVYLESIRPESVGSIQGSFIFWQVKGTGVTVEASTNGGAWTAVTNGGVIPGFTNGTDTTSRVVTLRFTFAAGTEQGRVSGLMYQLFKSKSISGSDNLMPAVPLFPDYVHVSETNRQVLSFHNRAGARLIGDTSGLKIIPSTTFGNFAAVELLVKVDSLATGHNNVLLDISSGGNLTFAATGGALSGSGISKIWVNGTLQADPTAPSLIVGRWNHVVVQPTNPITSSSTVYLGNNASQGLGFPTLRIGYAAMHYLTLSDSDVALLYGLYMGDTAQVVVDSSKVQISEPNYTDSGIPYLIYTYDWTIVAGG